NVNRCFNGKSDTEAADLTARKLTFVTMQKNCTKGSFETFAAFVTNDQSAMSGRSLRSARTHTARDRPAFGFK
ncbi:hypothetical protein, partial [Pelagibius sp. Alg239-R121]|uniref:hypothetical protein n=1 Tax=Pelagibius sp. Alg239-R121 TaxID=2993448 RepID=UPI0024A74024